MILKGDSGEAVTSVATEYHQKRPRQIARIEIEIEYLSLEERLEAVKELLWNYREYYLPHVSSDTTSGEEYRKYEEASDRAWGAMEAAFQNRAEFDKTLFENHEDEAQMEKAERLLQSWCEDMEWPEGDRTGVWTSTADSARECINKTKIFTTDRYWPFTKVIK